MRSGLDVYLLRALFKKINFITLIGSLFEQAPHYPNKNLGNSTPAQDHFSQLQYLSKKERSLQIAFDCPGIEFGLPLGSRF